MLSFLALKNNKNEKYDMDQAAAKDREIIKDTISFDMQKQIDEADLKIASVSPRRLNIVLLNFFFFFFFVNMREKHLYCSCNRQFSDWKWNETTIERNTSIVGTSNAEHLTKIT